jgi:hypothetical protein
MEQQPRVKHSANLLGDTMSMGRPTMKARNRNTMPPPMKQKKYINCCPLGTLQGKGGWVGGLGACCCWQLLAG